MTKPLGPDMDALQSILGYRFQDPTLLATALTPPSSGLRPDNQRMEFLGDAILQWLVSDLIYRTKPDWDEGAMSKLRGMLVCTETLCEWGRTLGLELIKGPRSTRSGAETQSRKPMADAMEALIAAIYLDARTAGRQAEAIVAGLIDRRYKDAIAQSAMGAWQERDSKTTLQEWAAASSLPAPVYELIDRGGPDHAPVFTVRVTVGGQEALASDSTLKKAQMAAARKLLGNRHKKDSRSTFP